MPGETTNAKEEGMKKTILVLTAFLCSALLCIALCFFFCRKTPLLQNGQALPVDLAEQQYRLDHFCPHERLSR